MIFTLPNRSTKKPTSRPCPVRMRICGLSGNIASGKSTVVARLVEEGVHVIDCDVIAKEAVEKVRRREFRNRFSPPVFFFSRPPKKSYAQVTLSRSTPNHTRNRAPGATAASSLPLAPTS